MSAEQFNVSGTTLSGIEVFTSLKSGERDTIAGLCRGQRYNPEQVILSHHADTHDVFFIISGIVRVTIFSMAGKEIMFRDESAGQMFGELAAIDNKPRSAHVIAVSDATVASMPPDSFWHVLQTYPAVAEKTLKYLVRLVRLLSDRVIEFSTLGVNNRIHAELLRLANDHIQPDGQARITPAPTHAEIASRVSTHREAVTRELNMLIKRGLVEKTGKTLMVLDVKHLQKMVHDVLGEVDI